MGLEGHLYVFNPKQSTKEMDQFVELIVELNTSNHSSEPGDFSDNMNYDDLYEYSNWGHGLYVFIDENLNLGKACTWTDYIGYGGDSGDELFLKLNSDEYKDLRNFILKNIWMNENVANKTEDDWSKYIESNKEYLNSKVTDDVLEIFACSVNFEYDEFRVF